ncbi:MAG TPA: response regulator [Gemmatimonadaceae bacterium]|nr:response regulator [Gemmatimonadaceae bacterium]
MPRNRPSTPARPRKVLIVEDERCIREPLVELFEVPGTTDVTAADSLDEALAALRRESFDLVITDIRLGARRDGGLQAMASASLLSPDAPVIALTAFPDDDNRGAARRLGARHFLEKPVDLTVIAALAGEAGVRTAMGAPAALSSSA